MRKSMIRKAVALGLLLAGSAAVGVLAAALHADFRLMDQSGQTLVR